MLLIISQTPPFKQKSTSMSKKPRSPFAKSLLDDEPYFDNQELIDHGQNDYSSAKSDYSSFKSNYTPTKPEIIEAEIDEVFMDPEDEFYTLNELEQLEDKSMAYMAASFKHIKFKKNPQYEKALKLQALQKKIYQDIINAIGLVKIFKQGLQEMRDFAWKYLFVEVSSFCEKKQYQCPKDAWMTNMWIKKDHE